MQAIRRIGSDEKGTILVFVAISLAVVLGMIALSFDLGRMAATQSELQSFADNVALAAAGELDGRPDAITRAQNAARDMIADTQSFGSGGRALDIADVTLTFLSALDPDDLPPFGDTVLPAPYTEEDAAAAIFVRAEIAPHVVPMAFASAFGVMSGGRATNTRVSASAVAGFTQYACQITPLMFCLPEPDYRADDPDNVGDLIVLRSSRQNAAWQPGNFGFLDPTATAVPDPNGPCGGRLSGRNLYSCLVGAAGPVTQCYNMRGVDMQPGQRVGISEAFNTRFDVYEATMGGERNVADYAPAPNTIKGFASVRRGGGNGQCDIVTDNLSMGLPRDDCMGPGRTCPSGNNRFGDGDWSQGRLSYVQRNYGGVDPHPTARTRYEYYLAEINRAGAGSILSTPRQETGRAQCHATPTADPNRRVIVAAGIDCSSTTFTGSASGVPVDELFRLFMVAPATQADSESPPNIDILVEVIGSAGSAGSTVDGTFHDVVQLYR